MSTFFSFSGSSPPVTILGTSAALVAARADTAFQAFLARAVGATR